MIGYLIPTREAVMRISGDRADIGRMLDLASQPEQKGFDSVWVGDSILARPRFEVLTTLAAIAARTRRVQLSGPEHCAEFCADLPRRGSVTSLSALLRVTRNCRWSACYRKFSHC